MSEQDVIYQLDSNGVASVTLNRPEVHNAFNDEVVAALHECFDRAGKDPAVRALLLRGAGKSFCAGGDMNWMKRMANYSYEENLQDSRGIAAMLRALNELPKTTIALVQGAAYGGGVGLAACCDITVATPRAAFYLSEVKVGMIPATISPYVARAIGQRAARRYFTTAEVIDAQRGFELGLVSEIFDSEETALAFISKLADGVVRNGPAAVANAKRLAFDLTDRPLSDELIEESSQRIARTRDSDEGREGLSAFLEKRTPNWIS